MLSISRLEEYEQEAFDTTIIAIKTGKIKPGKYSSLIKIKKDYKIDKRELFTKNDSHNNK